MALAVLAVLLLHPHSSSAGLTDPFKEAAGSYIVMVNGAPAFARKHTARLEPASLTKVMTALVVLREAGMEDVVAVKPRHAEAQGSRIGLKEGDRLRVVDLLSAMLITSANDACLALAEHVSGTEAAFVERMNKEAQGLGLRDTRFVNACGFDEPGHYSSARDLALLAEAALENWVFEAVVSLTRLTIRTLDGKRSFLLENSNALIGRYPGAMGVKTGHTAKAGKCLIALAERGGNRVLLVLLDAPDRWWTSVRMLDAAFSYAEGRGTAGAGGRP